MSSTASPVVLVEETIRQYRIPFYEGLQKRLAEDGRELIVAYSPTLSASEERRDAISPLAQWASPTSFKVLGNLGSRQITYQSVGAILSGLHQPLVIANQAVAKAENYQLVLARNRGRIGFATWGHGKTYSLESNSALDAVKRALTRASDWFFAYTTDGARIVSDFGFPASRISIVNNTIDTKELSQSLAHVTDVELLEFRSRHGLSAGRTALYLGGVDDRKGIDFLLESIRGIPTELPGFTLLVGGDGTLVERVKSAELEGLPIRYLGRLDGASKALALRATDVLAIPEWIGLVAVDSLVAGKPIVTTDHHSHSCEMEYLEAGRTCLVSEHDPTSYRTALSSALADPVGLRAMAERCRVASLRFSLDSMVQAFRSGINGWAEQRQCGLTGRARHPHGVADSGALMSQERSNRILAQDELPHQIHRISVIMTCHNRIERTLSCLGSLMEQRPEHTALKIFLVDDGSSDQTADRVRAAYPTVQVIEGNGDLFWAGGMSVAERAAQAFPFDSLLWINDDVTLGADAIQQLLSTHRENPDSIVVGPMKDAISERVTYGALTRVGKHPLKFRLIQPGEHERANAFNGNLVMVPRVVHDIVGPIDGVLGHAYADLDYGLRAVSKGIFIAQCQDTVGECLGNAGPQMPTTMGDRWRLSQTPFGQPWRSQVRYLRRHGGALWPAYLCWGYVRILMGWRS